MDYHRAMTQSLGDVLQRRNYGEPPEIAQIKQFVQSEIGVTPAVSMTTETFVIHLRSAAAAGALRSKLYVLQRELDTKKRLLIRIG